MNVRWEYLAYDASDGKKYWQPVTVLAWFDSGRALVLPEAEIETVNGLEMGEAHYVSVNKLRVDPTPTLDSPTLTPWRPSRGRTIDPRQHDWPKPPEP